MNPQPIKQGPSWLRAEAEAGSWARPLHEIKGGGGRRGWAWSITCCLSLSVSMLRAQVPVGCEFVWSEPTPLLTPHDELVYVERPRLLGDNYLLGDTIMTWSDRWWVGASTDSRLSFLGRLRPDLRIDVLKAQAPGRWRSDGRHQFKTHGASGRRDAGVRVMAASLDSSNAVWEWVHQGDSWRTPVLVGVFDGLAWNIADPSVVATDDGVFAMVPRQRDGGPKELLLGTAQGNEWRFQPGGLKRISAHSTLRGLHGNKLLATFLSVDSDLNLPDHNSVFTAIADGLGPKWGQPQLLLRSGMGSASAPTPLVDSAGVISIVWMHRSPDALVADSIRLYRSYDKGRTWIAASSLGWRNGLAALSAEVDEAGRIHVVFVSANEVDEYLHGFYDPATAEWRVHPLLGIRSELSPVLSKGGDGRLTLFLVSLGQVNGTSLPVTLTSQARAVCNR